MKRLTPLWQRPRTCSADNATARKEIETILPPADPAGGKIMCGCVMRFIRGGLGKRKSRSSKASGSTMVDDTRLELAEACRFAPGIRRLFRLSRLKLEFGHKLRVLIPEEKRKPTAQQNCRLLVDDTRLELVTSRTSSGCATSCANRPFSSATVILPDADGFVNTFFSFSHKPCIRRFFRSTRGRPSSFLRLRPSRCRCRFRWSSRSQRSGRSMTTDTRQ